MQKTKIVHISETFVSGVYTYIRQLTYFCSKDDRFQNFVIYSGERSETNDDFIKEDFFPNVEFRRITMSREISPLKDLKSLIKIILEIRKIKPEIIHVHSSKAGVLGRIARLFYPKAKLFYTPHGYSFIREDISGNKKQVYYLLEKIITKIFGGTIIACGDYEFIKAEGLGKAELIRNGVDIDSVSKHIRPYNNQKFTIGTSGKIYIPKNPELFNKLALKLPNYQFVWIGDGELKDKLTAENIIITGWKSNNETLKLANEFDVFLSTSSWEGLPFNIIEAMVLSKPIVSSNINGNKPTVINSQNGFLCDKIEDYVNAFQILEDKSIREQFGKRSFQIADELFNMNKNFNQLIALYLK
ncbi:glycosyltransferase [Flavobacterium aestivum]|uniref:glycosyltransferase n=1 Tax=Flavobacterium aestivum TaxID=3003257 RepID=UPI0022860B82|nr:glycosyltransferase [Flavobacterium aestivum]